jgi:hypothetical protein
MIMPTTDYRGIFVNTRVYFLKKPRALIDED